MADVGQLWELGAEQLVRIAAMIAAGTVIWSKAVAPLVFRPIGKALARGARHEAEAVVHELVDPQVELLRDGQTQLAQRLDDLTDTVGQVLDRMPPNP